MHMTSIFSKLRNITLGNLHAFLNDIIDETSIPSVEQRLRDLAEGRNQLQDTLASARHDLQVKSGAVTVAEKEIAELVGNIKLLGNGDPKQQAAALELTRRLQTIEGKMETITTAAAAAQDTVDKLKTAVDNVKAEEERRNGQLGTLRAQDATAKAKTKTAAAIDAMGDLMSDGGDVDNIAGRISERAAVADDRLSRAMDKIGGSDAATASAVSDAKAQARLAEILGRK